MNRVREYNRAFGFYILALLLLSITIGCVSNATRLASVKANYNAGKWGYVLGTARAKGVYSADEVIKHADDDMLTKDEAKLIKARALMQAFIQDKLAAGADATKDPDVARALTLIKELSSENFNLNWMNIEMMGAIADYFYMLDNYPAAFDAYDYLLNYGDFQSLNASQRQYIRRWFEMKDKLDQSEISESYRNYANEEFKKTYAVVVKKCPADIVVVKVGILILDNDGQPRAAIQRAMLAYYTAAKDPKTQKQFVKEIDELVDSILIKLDKVDPKEKSILEAEYKRFQEGWNAGVLMAPK